MWEKPSTQSINQRGVYGAWVGVGSSGRMLGWAPLNSRSRGDPHSHISLRGRKTGDLMMPPPDLEGMGFRSGAYSGSSRMCRTWGAGELLQWGSTVDKGAEVGVHSEGALLMGADRGCRGQLGGPFPCWALVEVGGCVREGMGSTVGLGL